MISATLKRQREIKEAKRRMIKVVRARLTDLEQQLFLRENSHDYFSKYSTRDLKDMIKLNKEWLMSLCDTDPLMMQ